MKTKILIVLSSLVLLLGVGCKKDETAAAAAAANGGGGASKTMLSSWAVSNAAWATRLDLNANLTGATFRLIIKMSDNTEVWCDNTYFTGSNDLGTYSVPNGCVSHGGMSAAITTAYESGGVGSYTNTGSSMTLCKFNGSCSTYY